MTIESLGSATRLERELAALTAAQSPDAPLWAGALASTSRTNRPPTTPGTLGSAIIPTWAAAAILMLVIGVVLIGVMVPSLGKARSSSSWLDPKVAARDAPVAFAPPPPAFEAEMASSEKGLSANYAMDLQRASRLEPQPAQARAVIRRATIDLTTAEPVRITFLKAQQLTSEAGGEFVENGSLTGQDDHAVATLTLRVAASRLSEVLNELRKLGTVIGETSGGTDVTEQIVDLDARLRNETRVEQELLELLDKRADAPLEDLLRLRQQMQMVRESIERLTGQRDRIGRMVALSSILVSIRAAAAPKEQPVEDGIADYFKSEIGAAWKSSLRFLADSAAFIVRVAVGGIVWWAMLIAAIFALRAWLRSRSRAAAAEPAPIG